MDDSADDVAPPGPAEHSTESVKVVVRCRPFNKREFAENSQRCITVDKIAKEIELTKTEDKDQTKRFAFDEVFDWNSEQMDFYNKTAKSIVESVLSGYNGTVFCYGQTGSGKTFTMEGVEEEGKRGLIPNCVDHIFNSINRSTAEKEFLVSVSMIEIYNEEIRDLLSKQKETPLPLKENKDKGVYVKGLTSYLVKNLPAMYNVMKVGKNNRTTGETEMNEKSSRSHSIFIVSVESVEKKQETEGEENHIIAAKLNMVDLAGSERQTKTGATGKRLIEGCKINLSLSALGNVISALVSKKQHIPYRDSKLTRILQDSLGGNTKTVMVANISPASYNYEETLSTLRYATRAKRIQNKPKINEDPKDAMLRAFKEEIERLRRQLEDKEKTRPPGTYAADGTGNFVGTIGISEEQLTVMRERIALESEELVKKMKEQSEEEKLKLMNQKRKMEEERLRIESELKKRHEELEKERKEKEQIQKKLEEINSQFVRGGVDIITAHKEQEQKIIQQKQELEHRKVQELVLKQELQENEEKRLFVEIQNETIQKEVVVKTKQLKKLWSKHQAALAEIEDLQIEFERDRNDYLFTIRQLEKEKKFLELVVQHFIPPNEYEKIKKRAAWNDEESHWELPKIDLSGNVMSFLQANNQQIQQQQQQQQQQQVNPRSAKRRSKKTA